MTMLFGWHRVYSGNSISSHFWYCEKVPALSSPTLSFLENLSVHSVFSSAKAENLGRKFNTFSWEKIERLFICWWICFSPQVSSGFVNNLSS